ncbi:MAG: DNA-binding protein [Prevotellaceae bacterium]|jgi:predicted histone-like DNA-binding protein|nr:DNA-binding protein [Prevotellaceae bacterium]
MPVNIGVVEKGNPLRPDETKKFYAVVKSTGVITLKTLGKKITQRCTVKYADTLAILEAVTQVLGNELSDGKIVQFGDFGSFRIGVSSNSSETKKKFTTSMIKSRKVIFRQGACLKEVLNNLTFENVETRSIASLHAENTQFMI